MNRLVLTRIAPWPAARLLAALYLIVGCVIAPFLFLIALVAPEQGDGQRGMGVMLAFFMPFIYGFIGFLIGGLGGLLYNLLARLLGGIPLMFETEPNHVVADPGHAGA